MYIFLLSLIFVIYRFDIHVFCSALFVSVYVGGLSNLCMVLASYAYFIRIREEVGLDCRLDIFIICSIGFHTYFNRYHFYSFQMYVCIYIYIYIYIVDVCYVFNWYWVENKWVCIYNYIIHIQYKVSFLDI